jgi:hypothetical protein
MGRFAVDAAVSWRAAPNEFPAETIRRAVSSTADMKVFPRAFEVHFLHASGELVAREKMFSERTNERTNERMAGD